MNAKDRKDLAKIADGMEQEPYSDAISELQDLLDAEQEKFDNMPEGLQNGDNGEKMQAAIDAIGAAIEHLTSAHDAVQEALSSIDEAVNA